MLERLPRGFIRVASVLAVSLYVPVLSENCINGAGELQECQYNTCLAAVWTVPKVSGRVSLNVSDPPPWSVKYFDDFQSHENLIEWVDFISNPLYGDPVIKEILGESESGRDIVQISLVRHDDGEAKKKPSVLIAANWHGDERISRQFALNLIEYFRTERRAPQSTGPSTLDDFDIHIVPVVNPDGFDSQTWYNSKGQDILWGFPSAQSADLDCDDLSFREGKAICAVHQAISPAVTVALVADRSIPSVQFPSGCSISFERPNSPYSCTSTLSDIFELWADTYAESLSEGIDDPIPESACKDFSGHLPFSEIPPSTLMTGDPAHYLDFALQRGSLPVLIDMARSNESDLVSPATTLDDFPETEKLDQLFDAHLLSLTNAMSQVFEYCLAVYVADFDSKEPLDAMVEIFVASDSLSAFAPSGFAARIVPHGSIRVSAVSPGYVVEEVTAEHANAPEECTTIEIELKRAPPPPPLGSAMPTPVHVAPSPSSPQDSQPLPSPSPEMSDPVASSPPSMISAVISFSLYFPGLHPSPRNVGEWDQAQFNKWLESNLLSSSDLSLHFVDSIGVQVVEMCEEGFPLSLGCESVVSLDIDSRAPEDVGAARTNGTALLFEGEEISAGGPVILLLDGLDENDVDDVGLSGSGAGSSSSSSPGQAVLFAALATGAFLLTLLILVISRKKKRGRKKGLDSSLSTSFQRALRSQKVACLDPLDSNAQEEASAGEELSLKADKKAQGSGTPESAQIESVQPATPTQLPINHAPPVLPPLREEQEDVDGYGTAPAQAAAHLSGVSGREREKRVEIEKRVTRKWKHARSHWMQSESPQAPPRHPQQSQPSQLSQPQAPTHQADTHLVAERYHAWS